MAAPKLAEVDLTHFAPASLKYMTSIKCSAKPILVIFVITQLCRHLRAEAFHPPHSLLDAFANEKAPLDWFHILC